MNRIIRWVTGIMICCGLSAFAQDTEVDTVQTANEVEITFLGHGTLMLKYNDKVIHIDPYSRVADYDKLPKADLVLITHDHGDHLDAGALGKVRTENTEVWVAPSCDGKVDGAVVLKNGDKKAFKEIGIEAVPAYNLPKEGNDRIFHPKGNGNGYILTFGKTRVYVAGDTEFTPEMKALKDIKVAFLPMNLPYTMTPEMVADAAKAFKPQILYPYHYGETDTSKLVDLLKDEKEIEVRIRNMP
ncbi:MAG: MBL fold metallo-hydrolase [Pontiellaceae bacterium]|nr:MBL fold metallo-hydrolase [Pontiellaceae bacterium]